MKKEYDMVWTLRKLKENSWNRVIRNIIGKHVIASNHNDEQLSWNEQCYSNDTEVYTEEGFKLWGEVSKEDKLAAVNIDKGNFHFEKPIELYRNHYEGKMIRMYSRDLDSLTTPEHRNFTSYYHGRKDSAWSNILVRTSQDILDGKLKFEKLPALPQIDLEEGDLKDYNLGRMYGFTLGDGGRSNDNLRVYFHVKKQRKKILLEEFETLNLVTITNRGAKEDYYYAKLLCKDEFFSSCFEISRDKYIDWDNLPNNKKFLQGLLNGLMNSDGHISSCNQWTYSTTSQRLRLDVEKLAVLLGREVTVHFNGSLYKLTIKHGKSKLIKKVESTYYFGDVFCASVSTGALLVRRNGKSFVSGNSLRYVNLSDSAEFYIPKLYRKQDTKNKQSSVKGFNPIDQKTLYDNYQQSVNESLLAYQLMISQGVCREQARGVLPTSVYTTFIWTVSLQALCNFISLRIDKGAQDEITEYAKSLKSVVEFKTPHTHKHMFN